MKLGVILVAVVALIDGGWALLFSEAALLKIAELMWNLQSSFDVSDYFQAKADYIYENRERLVCMLYKNRANGRQWENDFLTEVLSLSAGAMSSQREQSIAEELLSYLIPPLMGAQQMWGGLHYEPSVSVSCSCVENTGVWKYGSDGKSIAIHEGWNTPERVSYDATLVRNSEFSGGYIEAKLVLEPTLVNGSTLTVNITRDERSAGMSAFKLALFTGVGIKVFTQTLAAGANVIEDIPDNVNAVALTTSLDRAYSETQSVVLDCTCVYEQKEL